MGDYLSGGITFAGLGNGVDFQSMIGELKKIESIPKNRYEAWRADWQKRYDAFEELLKASTDTMKKLENINTMSKMLSKTAGSSQSSVATAKAGAEAAEGTYGINVKQLATNSVVTLTGKTFSSKDEVVAPLTGPDTTTFDYSYKGKDISVNIPKGMTIQGMVEQINKDPNNPGVKAALVRSGDGYVFQMQGKETGASNNITIKGSTNVPGFGTISMRSDYAYPDTADMSFDDMLWGAGAESFTFQVTSADGLTVTEHKYPPPGTPASGPDGKYTLGDVVRSIQNDPDSQVNAKWVKSQEKDGKSYYTLDISPKASGELVNVTDAGPMTSFTQSTDGAGAWSKRDSQDAKFTLNGLDDVEYSSATNELKEVFDGLTITLTDVGKTTLTVTTDTSKVKDNVVAFVDSFNELIKKFQELTKVSDQKTTISTGKAESQYETQKGSVLTGNYGVQLFNSQLKTMATGSGVGFLRPDGKGGGDPFATLGAVGIVMDSEEGSATFGQLKILEREKMEPNSPYISLDEALEKDAYAVADLLAGSGGVSDSPDFTYDNILTGVTKPGTYDVNYTVTGGVIGDVFIGGKKAMAAGDGKYTLMDGPGKGLTITILGTTEGDHSSTVRIKQGKASELHDFLAYQIKNEPMDSIKNDPTAPPPERGALQVLKDNYQEIMKSIDRKIEQEEARLVRWERTQKAQFSRLDTLLGQYDRQMQANASSLSQLVPYGS